MQWIQIIIFVLLLSGFFTLFDIRFTDLLNLLAVGKKSTLNDDIDVLLGKPAKGFFNRESVEIEQLLKSTGRENRFTMVKRISVLLFSLGAVVSLLLNNPFLIPILGAGFALAPVWYLRATASVYKKHLNEELETAISVVTTSYLRSGDLMKAVKENIPYLNPPVKGNFEAFITEASEQFGNRGAKQAQQILEQAAAMFAGGELSDEDKTAFMDEIQSLYLDSKRRAKKFTPKKYLDAK